MTEQTKLNLIQTRLDWADIYRGLGIVLVMLTHKNTDLYFHNWVYSFHIPLFFFLTGLLTKTDENLKILDFFKKNFLSIIFPYIIFGLVSIYYDFTLKVWQGEDFDWVKNWHSFFHGTSLSFNPALWFLPTFFLSKTIFFLSRKILIKKKFMGLWLFLLSILGFFIGENLETYDFFGYRYSSLFWGFDVALAGSFVVFLGFISQPIFIKNRFGNLKTWQALPISIIFLILSILGTLYILDSQGGVTLIDINFGGNRLHNYLIYYPTALSGIFFSLIWVRFLPIFKPLQFIGRHSLPIFGLHLLLYNTLDLFFKATYFVQAYKDYQLLLLKQTRQEILLQNFQTSFIYLFITLGIFLPSIWINQKYRQWIKHKFANLKKIKFKKLIQS